METNSLKNIWKDIDSGIEQKPKEELGSILERKIRKTMNKFYFFIGLAALISLAFIVFLLVTALNRSDDIIYQLINYTLIFLTLISLVSSVWSWNKLQSNKNNLPVKEWLEERIRMLSGWLNGKAVYFTIPVFFVLTVLSIHVYYENKPFTEVMKNTESLIGIMFGLFIGAVVMYIVFNQIRKHHRENLEYLKRLYDELSD